MAGVIKNVIRTLFTSDGASQTEQDFHRLTRAQNRLGAASVSAGRQFAAQASGMGGLVAAYAGAAATTFAISAAFDALAKSARAVQTIEGVNTLAANYAQSGNEVLASVNKITKGQLSMAEIAEQVNLSMVAGFSTDQINSLAEISLKASRALGRDLADSMTRVTRGSAKMEAELIDELGIYTKIEPATKAYAAALGKNVSALSDFERRQAFVNAVITEGQRKYASINTTVPTSIEQIEKLGASMSNIATMLGSYLADMIAPLASGMVENAAALFGALGIVLSLVAAKGVSLLETSLKSLVVSMQAAGREAENKWRAYLKITTSVLDATKATNSLTDAQLRLNAAQSGSLGKLRTIASERTLTRKELRQTNDLLKTSLTNLKQERQQLLANAQQTKATYAIKANEARAAIAAQKAAHRATESVRSRIVTGGINTDEARKKAQDMRAANTAERAAQAAARKAIAEQTALRMALQPTLVANNAALRVNATDTANTTAAINANSAAIDGWRARMAAMMGVLKAPLAKWTSSFGTAASFIVGKLSSAFFFVSMFQLIGSSIANAMGKGEEFEALMVKLGKAVSSIFTKLDTTKNTKTWLGITSGALSNIEDTNKQLRETDSFTFKDKFIGLDIEVTKTKEQLVRETSALVQDATNGVEKGLTDHLTSSTTAAFAGIGAMIGAFFSPLGIAVGAGIGAIIGSVLSALTDDEITASVSKFGKTVEDKFSGQLSGMTNIAKDVAIKSLSVIEDKYSDAALLDPQARAAKQLQQQLVLVAARYADVTASIGQVMAATGKTSDAVTELFNFTAAKDGIDYLQQGIINIGNTKVKFLFIDDMNKQLKDTLSMQYNTASVMKQNILTAVGDIANVQEGYTYDVTGTSVSSAAQSIADRIAVALRAGVDKTEIGKRLSEGLDPANPVIRDKLSYLEQAVYDAMGGKDLGSIIASTSLQQAYQKLAGPANEVQTSLLLTTKLLQETQDAYARGALSAEIFGQNLFNVQAALVNVNKLMPDLIQQQVSFAAAVALAKAQGDSDEAVRAQELLNATNAQIAALQTVYAVNKSIYKELRAQESVMLKQIEITNFLKEQGKGVMSDIDLQFAAVKAGADNAMVASEQFFSSLLAGNRAAATEANNYSKTIDNVIKGSQKLTDGLTPANITAINLASTANVAQTKQALQDVGNGLVFVSKSAIRLQTDTGSVTVQLVDQASQNAKEIVDMSSDALKKLAQDAFLEATNLAKKFGDTIAKTISDVDTALAELSANRKTNTIQFELDKLGLEQQATEAASAYNTAFYENRIKETELKVDLKKLSPTAGAAAINKDEKLILSEKQILLQNQKRIADEIYNKEQELLDDKLTREKDRINLEIDAKQAAIAKDYDLLKATIQVYSDITTQLGTAIVDSGNIMGQTIVSALNSGIQAFTGSFGALGTALGFEAQKATFTAAQPMGNQMVQFPNGKSMSQAELAAGKLTGQIASLEGGAKVATDALETLRTEQLSYAEEQIAKEKEIAGIKKSMQDAEFARQVALLSQQEGISELEAAKRLKDAGEADKTISDLQKRLKALFDAIKSNIDNTLMSLNNLVFYDEGSFKDIMANFFKTAQQDFFKITVADPLSTRLTEGLFKLGGVKTMLGADNATVKFIGGERALLVTLAGGSASLFPSVTNDTKKLEEKGDNPWDPNKGFFANITNQITGFFSKLFGKDGILGQLFSGLIGQNGQGGILSGLFSGILSIFGFSAQGGAVHMAQGGSAISSALKRDRVPAMLEPGEFVLRKQAVRSMGLPNVQAMNATGATPTGAPVINISNQGSPKDVQSAQPRFDGEKYVIDIVMRDFANNGPIRRSLRSNKGGL